MSTNPSKYDRPANGPIWFDRGMLHSDAFLSLKGATSVKLLIYFLSKCKKKKFKTSKGDDWRTINNGEIEIKQSIVMKKFKISQPTFTTSLRSLVEHGFIDQDYQGGKYKSDTSKFSDSTRWQRFGKKDFVFKTIRKRSQGEKGFLKKYVESA